MSNSTQNDEIKQMEKAMDEGFAKRDVIKFEINNMAKLTYFDGFQQTHNGTTPIRVIWFFWLPICIHGLFIN